MVLFLIYRKIFWLTGLVSFPFCLQEELWVFLGVFGAAGDSGFTLAS